MMNSSFDIRQADGVKVPAGYGSHFKSFDGKARKFLAESNGGPSWFTEYNVLAGLSSRSFGRFAYFVTRIASGRVERGLPLALRRCGYDTVSLYPAFGAFMSARSFQIHHRHPAFLRRPRSRRQGRRARQFLLRQSLGADVAARPAQPLFMFVYLAANHFPWETRFRPDLMPSWRNPGNEPVVDEYLRRQAMSADDYAAFVAGLKKKFPAEPFLIVRYGDHQPEFSPHVLDPDLDEAGIGKKLENYDPRYYATYYAIDAINFEPVKSPAVMETVDGAISAIGDPGSRRHPARSLVRRAEADHVAMQGRVLCLQGWRGSPPLQSIADRRRPDPGAVRSTAAWHRALCGPVASALSRDLGCI